MRALGLPHREVVRDVVAAILATKIENPALSRVLREQLPRVGRLRRLEQSLEQVTRMVAQYLEGHRDKLRVSSPERAAFFAVTMGESMTMAVATRRPHDAEAAVGEITDAIMRYLFLDEDDVGATRAPRAP